MKNNGGKITFLRKDSQQIKVNIKQKNNIINLNRIPKFQEREQNDNINQKDLFFEEMKNAKYQQDIDQNTYTNNSLFTEYDSVNNYSIKNDNVNQEKKNLILKNKNNQIKSISDINDNFSNKRTSTNKNNNNLGDNQNNNIRVGTKLNIYKSEIQYPLNFIKNVPRNNSNYKTLNNKNSQEITNEEQYNIKIPNKEFSKNKNKAKFSISSLNNIHGKSSQKKMRQNKSNLAVNNRRKKNQFKSPDPIDVNHISSKKTSIFNSFSKNESETINPNSYNTFNNFFQKEDGGPNTRKSHEVYLNNHIITNNFKYLNTIGNSLEDTKRNQIYVNVNINNEEIYDNKNENNYNNIGAPCLKKRNGMIKNNFNNNIYNDNINNNILNEQRHIKRTKILKILGNYQSLNNKEIKINNIFDINKFIQYKKKILEEFCQCLEEYIFINVKNNFDYFIFNLRDYSKHKYYNSLLLKRLQNKNLRSNLFKERSTSSNRFISQNEINQFSSSALMNNYSINLNTQEEYFRPSEYKRRKTINEFGENMSAIKNNDLPRFSKNYRGGKSQGRYDINNIDIDNYNNYYGNDTYYNNVEDLSNHHNNLYKKISSVEKNNNKYVENNVYIPKKFKQPKNNKISGKTKSNKMIAVNNHRNLKAYYNENNEYNEGILNIEKDDVNKSHDIDKNIIKAKIEKNYKMNYLKNNIAKSEDISYDNNYIINKSIENGLLNKSNNNIHKNIYNNNTKEKRKSSNINPIYKKKIKITQDKPNIFKSKQMLKKNSFIKKDNIKNVNLMKKKIPKNEENIPEKIKEQTIDLSEVKRIDEIKNNSINLDEIKLNLMKDKGEINDCFTFNNNYNQIINNNNQISQIEEAQIEKNIQIINDNGKDIKIQKKIEEENLNILNEIKNNNINGQNNDIDNNEYNGMSNGKNIKNEDENESYENIKREIIVKDVSTRDKRLNVFIKYLELPQRNELNKYSNSHLLNIFQTDSFFLPSSYSQKYNYYKNYYYGNSSDKNKLKIHKILSSIIEEEEKSKAAGSINNSLFSDEGNSNGNYSHFFKQSIKYVTNFLQSIFDDKKKDILFQFFKILKRIKNDSFLKGLINQKKLQALNKIKDENEEENENNTSGDVLLYNANDNFNIDIDYLGSKSNDRKDISNLRNMSIKNRNKHNNINKNKKEKILKNQKDLKEEYFENNKRFKKYPSAKNFLSMAEEKKEINIENINLSMDIDKRDLKNKFNNNYDEEEMNNNQQINENLKINEENDININKEIKEESILNVDYEKNVTISEACRGLSDVILDFKIYLIKFCLKNKNEKK